MYTTSTTASSDPSLAALNFLPAAPQGNTPQELIDNGGFDAALYQTLPGLLNLSGGDDDFAHLTVPNSQDASAFALPGPSSRAYGAASTPQKAPAAGPQTPAPAGPPKPRTPSAWMGSGAANDAPIREPGAGTTRGTGKREVDSWLHGSSTGSTLDQTGAWTRSKEYSQVGGGELALQGYGEAGAGALGKVTEQKDLGDAGTLTSNANGLAGTSARGFGQIDFGVGGYNLQGGGQARVGSFGDGNVTWQADARQLDIGGCKLDLTPTAGVNGSAMLGAEAVGTSFFGVSYPSKEEAAQGVSARYGVELGGSAFAGAKVTGGANLGFGGNNVGVQGGLMAGIGLEGSFKAERVGTRLGLNVGFGAALGLGASLGFKLDLNIKPLLDAFKVVSHAFEKIKDGASTVEAKVKEGVSKAEARIKKLFGG